MTMSMDLTVVACSEDGSSHFADAKMPLIEGSIPQDAPPYSVTGVMASERLVFSEFPAGFSMEWHPAPRRQFILVLSGRLDISTGDGDHRPFTAGDVLLVTDTNGSGHCSKVPADGPCRFASIALSDSVATDDLMAR